MTDKFGIELQVGDIVACVNMNSVKDSPFLSVILGFTPQKLVATSLMIWNYQEVTTFNELTYPHNFIKVNEEQIEALIHRIYETRVFYEKVTTLEQVRAKANELILISEQLKEAR